jgi:hypothetical protein
VGLTVGNYCEGCVRENRAGGEIRQNCLENEGYRERRSSHDIDEARAERSGNGNRDERQRLRYEHGGTLGNEIWLD